MGFVFVVHVCDSGMRFLLGIQVLDTSLGLRFGVQVWIQVRDSSLGLRFGIQVSYSNGGFRVKIQVRD